MDLATIIANAQATPTMATAHGDVDEAHEGYYR